MVRHNLEPIGKNINKCNLKAYSKISATEIRKVAKTGGLDSGCDIALVKNYILKSSSILEVGAGYGRVIEHLVNIDFAGKITAIEYSQKFCRLLRRKFLRRAKILNENLYDINSTNHFDCVLFLWNGISDFPKYEQPEILQRLLNLLIPGGILIFDTFPLIVDPLNSVKIAEREYYININGKSIRVYCPTMMK